MKFSHLHSTKGREPYGLFVLLVQLDFTISELIILKCLHKIIYTIVISDGGTGFTKAFKYVWPLASHQRCLFHAFCQVRRYITNAPKTMAGRDLLSIARNLFKVKTPEAACVWIKELRNWRILYNTFLQEMTTDEYGNIW